MESRQEEQARKEVTAVIADYFEVGKSKDLASISKFFAPSRFFSRFDETPPYTRQTAEEAFVYDQSKFANISDFQYEIKELRIDILGFTAVATFYLTYSGVFVNDYSFEGSTVGSRSRETIVLGKFGGAWKIVHQHASAFPSVSKATQP